MADIKVVTEEWLDAQGVRNFVWSGARDRVADLTDDQIDTIINILSDEYPDGIDGTALNDFLWFEDDTYAEWLGYRDAEALWTGKGEDYYEIDKKIKISRADIADLEKDEDLEYWIDNYLEYNEDYDYMDDHQDYDDNADMYLDSGYAIFDVSQSGIDKLVKAGIKFTEI